MAVKVHLYLTVCRIVIIYLVIGGHMAYEVSGDELGGTLSTAKVPPLLPPVLGFTSMMFDSAVTILYPSSTTPLLSCDSGALRPLGIICWSNFGIRAQEL